MGRESRTGFIAGFASCARGCGKGKTASTVQ